jgi:hypothetical protein
MEPAIDPDLPDPDNSAHRIIWSGLISDIQPTFKTLPLLQNKLFRNVDVVLHSAASYTVERQKRAPKIYPSRQGSYAGYTWDHTVSPSIPLITEYLHCAGGSCAPLGPAKYPKCEVRVKVVHYAAYAEIWITGSHGDIEVQDIILKPRGLSEQVLVLFLF